MCKIISVVGPTASGKTRLSVELAKKLSAQIVSVDSMQIYRKLDIKNISELKKVLKNNKELQTLIAENFKDNSQ